MFLSPHKDGLKILAGFRLVWISSVFVGSLCANSASAQHAEPSGRYVSVGLAGINGAGFQIGFHRAGDFTVREALLLMDLLPLADPARGRWQIAGIIGGGVRLFGFERTVGNTPYRGFDVDLGLRAGPALSFTSRETRTTRNTRFTLFVEPFLRYSRKAGTRRVFYLEVGVIRPVLRFGLWFPIRFPIRSPAR